MTMKGGLGIPLILFGLSIAFHLGHGVEELHRKGVHDARGDHLGLFKAGAQVSQGANSVSTRCDRHVELLDHGKEDCVERREPRGLLRLLLLLLVMVGCIGRTIVSVHHPASIVSALR